MKAAVILASITTLIISHAEAQVLAVQVRNGNVYVQQAQGWGRVTQDGHATEAAKSRDGSLVAYIHNDGEQDGEPMNSVSLCVVAAGSCRVIVAPRSSDDPTENLTGASTPAFSYQASAANGTIVGSLFFMTSGWATSGAIHQVTFGLNPAVTFVTPSNSLLVVPGGRFAGALDITQHIYAPQGGSCDQERIFDPNTKKVLQTIPTSDCQALHIQ